MLLTNECALFRRNFPIAILEFLDESGHSPYGRWFAGLNANAAAKITVATDRIGRGQMSNVDSAGGGVYER